MISDYIPKFNMDIITYSDSKFNPNLVQIDER